MNTPSEDWVDIVLRDRDAIHPELATPVSERHYGATPEIEVDNVQIRIGSRPVCRDLKRLYEQSGRTVPDEMQDLFASYRVLMLMNSMSVMREPGNRGLGRVGFEVDFPESSGVTIIENLPKTEFIKKIGADADSRFLLEVGLALTGKLAPCPEPKDLLPKSEELPGVGAAVHARLDVTNKVDIVAKFSHEIVTSIVVAVGEGDMYSQWLITRQKRPLIGDFPFTQILLVPKHTESLEFSVRASAVLTTFHFIPDKRRSGWVKLTASLPE